MKNLVVALLMGSLMSLSSVVFAGDACCPLSKQEEVKSDSTVQATPSEKADQIVKDESANEIENIAAVEKE